MNQPYSAAADRNKSHILNKLKLIIDKHKSILEIGSGTGQHATYFAKHLPVLDWQTADLEINHQAIAKRIKESKLSNVFNPLTLDVNNFDWKEKQYEIIYTANTLHIVSWEEVKKLIEGVKQAILNNGLLIIYGPFNYNGQFTSESNEQFNEFLKNKDPKSGIREFEKINELASKNGFTLAQDFEMPANNRLIYWQKE